MASGMVTKFLDDRGFGFIRPADGGLDVFVHAKDLLNRSALKGGEHVEFEVVTDERRGNSKHSASSSLAITKSARAAMSWSRTMRRKALSTSCRRTRSTRSPVS
jgi:CspA family cold shock protein